MYIEKLVYVNIHSAFSLIVLFFLTKCPMLCFNQMEVCWEKNPDNEKKKKQKPNALFFPLVVCLS